jgi:hypothetical protein
MSWEEGTGFRIIGTVVRTFVSQSGKFGKLTLKVSEAPHPPTLEFKTQDRIVIGELKQLRQGQRVQVKGKIQNEKVCDKRFDPIKVDGYEVWVPVLRPHSFEVEGSSRTPADRPNAQPASNGAATDPLAGVADPFGGGDPMGGGSDPFGG